MPRKKKKKREHAQTSLEFLVVFAIALAAILVFTTLSQSSTTEIQMAKVRAESQNSVGDLKAAADEVYSQGSGAKKQVYITIPSGYEPHESFIANKSIRMRVAGNDFVETTRFDVHGTLPPTEGKHWVWVISEGSGVRIGDASIELDKVAIYILMSRNETKHTQFAVMNVGGERVNVTIAEEWAHSDVLMDPTPTSFSLDIDEERQVMLTFNSNNEAIGYYTGKMDVVAVSSQGTEILPLPVTAEVAVEYIELRPRLTITPSSLDESMLPNTTITRSFLLCTNTETTLDSVDFNPSPGNPGQWIGGTDTIGRIDPDSCVVKIMNVSVPAGTSSNNYTGFVGVAGNGADGANDSIAVLIDVGGDPDDSEGPVVHDIFYYPNPLYEGEPVTVTANASDELTGNNSIQSCEIRFDGGPWFYMSPSDGAFDEPVEDVYYKYAPGFSMGSHVASIRCTDSKGNVGDAAGYTIKVMKEILFVTKGGWWKSSEWDWILWFWWHNSWLGYLWNMDTAPANSVISGSTDVSYYSVIMMSEYQQAQGLSSVLKDYVNDGGRVIFVGAANELGPREIGLTTDVGNPYNEKKIDITDNSHFITSALSQGVLTILSSKSQIYGIEGFSGTTLAVSDKFDDRTVLGESGGYIVWGTTRPYRLLDDGDDITRKVIDHSIEESTID